MSEASGRSAPEEYAELPEFLLRGNRRGPAPVEEPSLLDMTGEVLRLVWALFLSLVVWLAPFAMIGGLGLLAWAVVTTDPQKAAPAAPTVDAVIARHLMVISGQVSALSAKLDALPTREAKLASPVPLTCDPEARPSPEMTSEERASVLSRSAFLVMAGDGKFRVCTLSATREALK